MGKVNKTDREWQRILTPEEYQITRQKGTEAPFTGKYWNTKKAGTYTCKCCGEPLFTSEMKYDSGCGWPSFYQAIGKNNIVEHEDLTYGMVRTEITCQHCGAHLGHVFDDGPQPTGIRYCVNSASLNLKTTEQQDEENYP